MCAGIPLIAASDAHSCILRTLADDSMRDPRSPSAREQACADVPEGTASTVVGPRELRALRLSDIQRFPELSFHLTSRALKGCCSYPMVRKDRSVVHISNCAPVKLSLSSQTCTFIGKCPYCGTPTRRWLHNEVVMPWTGSIEEVDDELALMCGRMFPEESNEVEKYVSGLPDMIRENVITSTYRLALPDNERNCVRATAKNYQTRVYKTLLTFGELRSCLSKRRMDHSGCASTTGN
ncbi:hypothetical protein Tco_0721265 [Tanacetum coccineum]